MKDKSVSIGQMLEMMFPADAVKLDRNLAEVLIKEHGHDRGFVEFLLAQDEYYYVPSRGTFLGEPRYF